MRMMIGDLSAWITAAIIALAIVIIKNWDKIKAVTLKVWGWISGYRQEDMAGKIKQAASKTWDAITRVISKAWDFIKRILRLNPFIFVLTHLDWIKAKMGAAWDWIKQKVTTAWNAIKGLFKSNPFTAIQGFLNTMKGWFTSVFAEIGSKIDGVRPEGQGRSRLRQGGVQQGERHCRQDAPTRQGQVGTRLRRLLPRARYAGDPHVGWRSARSGQGGSGARRGRRRTNHQRVRGSGPRGRGTADQAPPRQARREAGQGRGEGGGVLVGAVTQRPYLVIGGVSVNPFNVLLPMSVTIGRSDPTTQPDANALSFGFYGEAFPSFIRRGAPVNVWMGAKAEPDLWDDIWDDIWTGQPPDQAGGNQRFIGRVADITATPDVSNGKVRAEVTCIGMLTDLADLIVGDEPWPIDTDHERVERIRHLTRNDFPFIQRGESCLTSEAAGRGPAQRAGTPPPVRRVRGQHRVGVPGRLRPLSAVRHPRRAGARSLRLPPAADDHRGRTVGAVHGPTHRPDQGGVRGRPARRGPALVRHRGRLPRDTALRGGGGHRHRHRHRDRGAGPLGTQRPVGRPDDQHLNRRAGRGAPTRPS